MLILVAWRECTSCGSRMAERGKLFDCPSCGRVEHIDHAGRFRVCLDAVPDNPHTT